MITVNELEKIFDLEERTFQFAKNVRLLIKKKPFNSANFEDGKQVVRSLGSVGANYIEANDPLGDKDYLMRLKICRKAAQESIFFLRLIAETNSEEYFAEANALRIEAIELKKIFSTKSIKPILQSTNCNL